MAINTIFLSVGRDYRFHGRVYEYCIFRGEVLVARQGGFKSTDTARNAGIRAAETITDNKENA